MKKLIAIFLCVAMLTALVGCNGTPAQTTEPTTVPTTAPAPTAGERYAEAAAKLDALTSAEVEITYIEEMTLGADSFKSTTRQTVTLLGLGTDAFSAFTEEEFRSGAVRIMAEETYLDGMLYNKQNNNCFQSELSAEDYQARLLPLELIDGSLYASVEQTSDTEFTFSDATALERWCDNPYATLETAAATAELDENGMPCQFTYQASFAQGAADMNISVTVELRETEMTQIELPANADSYVLLDTPEGPELISMVAGYLDQATSICASSTDVITCQAAAFTDTTALTMTAYGEDATQIAQFISMSQFADLSTGETDGYTLEETYLDGILTTVLDDGEPETIEDLTSYDIAYAVDNELFYLIPAIDDITDFDLTVIGDTALLEYTLSEDSARSFEEYYCEMYFEDPEILRRDASATAVNAHGGYIGIDLTTGMPLSIGQTFNMTHTIEGGDYVLSADYNQSIRLGAPEAYETITGEPLPEEEPEELAKPVFYKVTGDNGEQMWLLGTIHVGDVRTAHLPQEIYDAFDASDALAVEFETESYTASLMEDQEAIEAYIMTLLYTDGTTLKDHLADEALYNNTIDLLKATGNFSNEAMVLLTKPVFHFQTLQNYFMSNGYRLSSDYGVDIQLEQRAKERGKEILSVESGEFQLDMLANFSDELQELMLKQTIEAGQFSYNYSTEELYEMWCSGDEAALAAYLNEDDTTEMTDEEKALYEEYNNAMGTDRNDDMLEVAKGYLNSGDVVFYAVGLAHLLADDGLVNTLRDAGYTVELVSYAG